MPSLFSCWSSIRCLGVMASAAAGVALFSAGASAEVAAVTFQNLAKGSDLIVIATVSKIETVVPDPNNHDYGHGQFDTVEIATAQVVENLKGEPVREVQYFATPTFVCDTSCAIQGERVVLLLEKVKDSPYMAIAHCGCGRMPLRALVAKEYAFLEGEVILPPGTATPSKRVLELETLRELVKSQRR